MWRGQWRDAKGFRFYLLDGERIVHLLSWHQVQNEEQLGEALTQIKEADLIPEEQVRLCVVCDGAEWIWKHVQALFPQARQVLDYYHCAQYIHKIAKAQYGTSLQGLEWAEATMTRLYMGKVSAVLGRLRRMQPTSAEALKAIDNCWAYLNGHRDEGYGMFRRGGYPLGSGGMESANKFICHVRLKRSGAWWYEANSNQMLALRCTKYNGTFEQVFTRYQHRKQIRQNHLMLPITLAFRALRGLKHSHIVLSYLMRCTGGTLDKIQQFVPCAFAYSKRNPNAVCAGHHF